MVMGCQGEKVNANYWLLYHIPRNCFLSCFYHHYSALLVLINLGLLNKGTGSTLMFYISEGIKKCMSVMHYFSLQTNGAQSLQ